MRSSCPTLDEDFEVTGEEQGGWGHHGHHGDDPGDSAAQDTNART